MWFTSVFGWVVCFKCYWHEGQDAKFPRKTLHCNKMVNVEHWITGQCGWWVYSYHFTAQAYISCSVHFDTRLWSVWSNEYSPHEPDAVGAAGASSPRVWDSGLKYYCLVVIKFSFKKWTVQTPKQKHRLVTLHLIEIFVVKVHVKKNTLLNPLKFSATVLWVIALKWTQAALRLNILRNVCGFQLFGWLVVHLSLFGWGVRCEVTSVNSVIRQTAGGKCPSSADWSNPGSPSRWYFRLLDAGPFSLCRSRILKRSRTDEHVYRHKYNSLLFLFNVVVEASC